MTAPIRLSNTYIIPTSLLAVFYLSVPVKTSQVAEKIVILLYVQILPSLLRVVGIVLAPVWLS